MSQEVDYYDVQSMIRDSAGDLRGDIRAAVSDLRADVNASLDELREQLASIERVLDARTERLA